MTGKEKENQIQKHKDFENLVDLLPLSTPLFIFIDPANACNFRCTFCPTGDLDLLKSVNRPIGVMRYSLFTKIIDDMTGFDKKVRKLYLFKDGEPFLNKELGKMISYAKKKDVAKKIEVTTNGSLLTDERINEIIDSDLDLIRISIEHVNSQDYKKITQNFSDYNTIVKNIKNLYNERERRKSNLIIVAKIIGGLLNENELQKFENDFSLISDRLQIESMMGWDAPDNQQGRDFTLGIDRISPRKILACSQPFYTMVINFNGQVSACCVDWSLDTLMADASKENLVNIWNSQKISEFRMFHLNGERKNIKACSNCQFPATKPKEYDIDNAIPELLKNMKSRPS